MAIEANPLIQHEIDVSNFLYGSAHFITLHLSPEWEIARGVGHPEVTAAHDRGEQKWVAGGKAWYVLYHKQSGWAMELSLEAKPGRKQNRGQVAGSRELTVHGHPASIRRWEQRRGLFHPKAITFVEVTFDCEHSDRNIRLELSGRCPPEGFEAMLAMIPEWQCH
jgi:hypothetical protein